MNLTTTVDSVVFNHDDQLMAFSSHLKRDALRIVCVEEIFVVVFLSEHDDDIKLYVMLCSCFFECLCMLSLLVYLAFVVQANMNSLSIFSNWPTSKTALRYVNCAAFSPNSGYFAVGNDRGLVPLFRLKHYSEY